MSLLGRISDMVAPQVVVHRHLMPVAEAIARHQPGAPIAQPSTISPSQPRLVEGWLTEIIAQADNAPEQSRSGGATVPGTEGYMHVSSLMGICEREHAISYQHGLPLHRQVMGAMRIIWALGRAAEKHVRNNIIQTRHGNGVYGRWECRCGHTYAEVETRPSERVTCPRCNHRLDTYKEPVLVDHIHGVIGSPDVTLIEMGWWVVVEIKSMTKDQYDKLTAPLADHILQACAYRRMYKQQGRPVHDKVIITYVRKDFRWGGRDAVYKEFHVNAADWDGQIDNHFAAAQRVLIHNRNGTLPERTICSRIDCTRAKDCQRSVMCFSMN